MVHIVIRLRGTINTKPKIRKTLELLNLHRTHHAVIVSEDPSMKGMLMIAKDYITWGEADPKLLADAIKKRGQLVGHKPVTDEYVKANTKYATIEAFATAIVKGEIKYNDLPDVKPILRLAPPKKGYKTLKHGYGEGGDLGYRGKEIGKLVERML